MTVRWRRCRCLAGWAAGRVSCGEAIADGSAAQPRSVPAGPEVGSRSVTSPGAARRPPRSLPQVEPNEAGPILLHELRTLPIDLVVLLLRLRSGLIVLGLAHRLRRHLDGPLPLPEFLLHVGV